MLRAALLLSLTACCIQPPAVEPPNVLLIREGWPPVGRGNGSGVVIQPGWVLTAAHMVPLTSAGGLRVTGVFRHPTLDLALLRVPGAPYNGLKAATEVPKLYDRLYVYGWHLGFRYLKTQGFQGHPGFLSADVVFGVSGGAVINTRGRLVGIITAVGWIPEPRDELVFHIAGYVPLTESVLRWIRKTIS